MKQLLLLAKNSAKQVFRIIRQKSPYYCNCLDVEISITKKFLQHILYDTQKNRSSREITERILIMPFIGEILSTGEIYEKREGKYVYLFEVSKKYKHYKFSIIIQQSKKTNQYILLRFRR